jgi:hypothetical protein
LFVSHKMLAKQGAMAPRNSQSLALR